MTLLRRLDPLFQGKTWRFICLACGALVLLFDLQTPPGYAHGGLYLLLLLMAVASRSTKFVMMIAVVSVLFTIIGAIMVPPGPLLYTVIANRITSTVEIILFTLLCLLFERHLRSLALANRDLDASLELVEQQQGKIEHANQRADQAMALLVESGPSFRDFADCIPQIIWTATPEGIVDFSNRTMQLYSGMSLDELLQHDGWQRTVAPEDLESCLAVWIQAMKDCSNYSVEFRIRRHDGLYRWHLVEASPLYDSNGTLYKWCGAAIDIHEIKLLTESLRSKSEYLANTLENLIDGFISINKDGLITFVNREAAAIFKQSPAEMTGQPVWQQLGASPTLVKQLSAAFTTGDRQQGRLWHETLSRWLDVSTYPVEDGMAVCLRDITETRQLEERFGQSQRLESLGQLTGGIAHDFNNLLTVILGNAELLNDWLNDGNCDPEVKEMIEVMELAAYRGAELTSRLLAFARRQTLEPRTTTVRSLILGMESLIRRTLPENLSIILALDDGLWPVMVDPSQLENAILNLCLNSRDAMPTGGQLTIEAANKSLEDDYPSAYDDIVSGDYVMIAVSDNGCGIPPELLAKVFDPFFTTKENGKGNGLGLSMVYGFVTQSRGQIKIYSEQGHGTTVRMYLPRSSSHNEEFAASTEDNELNGTELILVVEDNDLVRKHSLALLRSLGYRVLSAANALEALALLAQHSDIALMFTDIIMPGSMNGRELADEALRRRPGLRVLFTSGYTENAFVQHPLNQTGIPMLSKPYQRRQLSRKLRQVLDDD